MAIKNVETDSPVFKARFFVQGHKDNDKEYLVHNSTNLRQYSTRIVAFIASINGFDIWTQDVTQAYLQSTEKLLRKVYLKPPKELNLSSDEVLEPLKPLYGLPDSGDYWNRTMSNHITNNLGMTPSYVDNALFIKVEHDQLLGLTGIYVDDSIHCGNKAFAKLTDETAKLFDSREKEFNNTKFAGVSIEKDDSSFHLHMKEFLDSLSQLSKTASFKDFRSLRAKLAWLVHVRPDICCAVALASQVTEDTFCEKSVSVINKVLTHLKSSKDLTLKYPPLDKNSLRMVVFSDAAFSTSANLTSQLGYIILLADDKNNCHILHYCSRKSSRVVRSVLASEVYAFADAFDMAYTLRQNLTKILCRTVKLTMLTDSKSLFDIITKCSQTTEKRLMIDIAIVKEAYEYNEICNVGFVRTDQNPADAMTKIMNSESLLRILLDNKCDMVVDRWVIRLQDESRK